jgi:hypothetical protein
VTSDEPKPGPEQVLGLLIQQLVKIVEEQEKGQYPAKGHDSDFSLQDLARAVLGPQLDHHDREAWRPLYDAAWELCRIGVLRPGEIAPRGMLAVPRLGDFYSITEFGRRWLKEAADRPFLDQSHLNQVLQSYGERFGDGYRQRSVEAVRSYQTCNYLAACVMSGAAAESILLALAIAKSRGDEKQVLGVYLSRGGRDKVMKSLLGGVAEAVAIPVRTALDVMKYWRDDAGHGVKTSISVSHAGQSLTQLMHLAQIASDHWDKLTTTS